MIWLTWRQFRSSALIAAAGLGVVAALLALTTHGPNSVCVNGTGCNITGGRFLGLAHDHLLQYLSTILVAVPALIGAFWGAPIIARELEAGTWRLVWTQGVTRTRWLTTKLAGIVLAAVVVCGLFSVMLTEWSSKAINRGRISPAMFGERGVVAIGYAVFALGVGVTAGLLIRRVVPAMAVTLSAFVAARMAVQYLLRAHLLPAVHAAIPITPAGGIGINQTPAGLQLFPGGVRIPGAWIFSDRIVDSAGHAPTTSFLVRACPDLSGPPPPGLGSGHRAVAKPSPGGFDHCLQTVGTRFHVAVTYQPASHYWALQFVELGIFLVAGLALLGGCVWWIRHRLA
jgi:ABC-2 family transporter protein